VVVGATDWATVVPAWLALGGAFAALLAYLGGRTDARRRHAAAVFVVVTSFRDGTKPHDPLGYTRYCIHNNGDLPLTDVRVSMWKGDRRKQLWRFQTPDGWLFGGRVKEKVFPTIFPPNEADAEEHDFGMPPLGWESNSNGTNPPLTLVFCDGNGRRWVRWPDGRLSRLRWWRRQKRTDKKPTDNARG